AALGAGLTGVVAGAGATHVAPARLLLVEALLADRRPAVDDAQLRTGLVDPPLGTPLAHAQLAPAIIGTQFRPAVTGAHRGPARVVADVVAYPVLLPALGGDLTGIVVEVSRAPHVVAQPALGPGLLALGGSGPGRLRPVPILP